MSQCLSILIILVYKKQDSGGESIQEACGDAGKGYRRIYESTSLINCCGASVTSEQQRKQDLRGIYEREYEFSKSCR